MRRTAPRRDRRRRAGGRRHELLGVAPVGEREKQPGGGAAAGTPVRAVWNGLVLAESADPLVVEGNHYFPPDAVNCE